MLRDDRHRALIESAVANGGWATVAMARACGFPASTFRDLARRHGWRHLQRSCYAMPGFALDWRAHARAAMEAVGPPVALTGAAALEALGSWTGLQLPPVQLVVPAGRSAAGVRPPVHVLRSTILTRNDVLHVGGFDVTSPAWALAHLGRDHDRETVLRATIAARQAELVTLPDLDEVLSRGCGARGIGALRTARDTLSRVRPDSGPELELQRLLRSAGLRPEPSTFPYRFLDGRVRHLDIAFPDTWVAFEVDVFSTHDRTEQSFERDRERWTQARRSGWELFIVTPSRLRREPEAITDEARKALADASPTRAPALATRCDRPTCPSCLERFGAE